LTIPNCANVNFVVSGPFLNGQLSSVDAVQEFLEKMDSDFKGISAQSIFRKLHVFGTIDKLIAKVTGGNLVKAMEDFFFDAINVDIRVDATNRGGSTALHIAARAGKFDSVCKLIELKADIYAKNSRKETALHLAAQMGRTAVVMKLLDFDDLGGRRRLKDTKNEKGESALTLAAAARHSRTVDLLRQRGADGWKPLLYAVEKGSSLLRSFLKRREKLMPVLKSAKDGKFWNHKWFVIKMISYKRFLISSKLTWSAHDSRYIELSEDKLTAFRRDAAQDTFSCVLGNEEFADGVHVWEIAVHNVSEMWMGIFRGGEDRDNLNALNRGDFVLGISNKGEPVIHGPAPELRWMNPASYVSGQIVKFKLDMNQNCFTVKIDGQKVLFAKNVDTHGKVRPYVSMRYQESASFVHYEHRKKFVQMDFKCNSGQDKGTIEMVEESNDNIKLLRDALEISVTIDDMRHGLDNSVWTENEDQQIWEALNTTHYTLNSSLKSERNLETGEAPMTVRYMLNITAQCVHLMIICFPRLSEFE
jgi:hypothetical protein